MNPMYKMLIINACKNYPVLISGFLVLLILSICLHIFPVFIGFIIGYVACAYIDRSQMKKWYAEAQAELVAQVNAMAKSDKPAAKPEDNNKQ